MTTPDAQAFPSVKMEGWEEADHGLTKREYFAAMAMQGIIGARTGFMVDCGTDNFATWAVQCADRLIEELNKPAISAEEGKEAS